LKKGENFGLAFPREEYDRRLAAVREGMAARGLEVLLLFAPANLFYMLGYNTAGYSNYQCLLVSLDRDPVLVVRLLERPVAEATTWLETVWTYEDHEEPESAVHKALHDAGLATRKLAAERTSPFLDVQSYMRLRDILGAELADGTGIVDGVRLIKSPAELEYVRIAAHSTEAGMHAALDAIAEGKTENDVMGECYRAMVAAGSEFFSSGPILTSGEKAGIAHTSFHRRRLQPGDSVMIEIGGVWNRYAAPMFRTAAVGEAPAELQRMHDACREALEAAIGAIRPGARSQDVQAACQAVVDARGYEPNFRKRVGYALGVGFPPTWGEGHIMDLKHHDTRELRPGMLFHIVPAMRQHREYGVGISETVVVTDRGAEVITNFSRELFVSV
jgi:Xaa-Pro dipeptidase